MKQTLLLIALLFAGTLSAQVEKWTFSMLLEGDSVQSVSESYFAADGRWRNDYSSYETAISTLVDSVKGEMLVLTSSEPGGYYDRFPLEPAGTVSESRWTMPLQEGTHFRLLPDTRIKHGFTLLHVERIDEGFEGIAGWIIPGKTITGQSWILADGRRGAFVEGELKYVPEMIVVHLELKDYEPNARVGASFFDQIIPEGYRRSPYNLPEEPEEMVEPVQKEE